MNRGRFKLANGTNCIGVYAMTEQLLPGEDTAHAEE